MSRETLEVITFFAGVTLAVGGTIGCITGLIGSALGFTAFLPIVLGSAIIASAALSSTLIFWLLFTLYQAGHEELLGSWSLSHISSIAIGVGLAASVNTVSLGAMSTIGIGIIIGIGIPLLACVAGEFIKATVEVVKEHFSSQEKNDNCTTSDPNVNGRQPSNTLESVDPSEIKGEDKNLVAAKT
ncbi:hypothetical protein [Wolbachia endosymbiont of Ctenocephalides felis wCfeJ]|uniref:hypothetical protein n=1 Tax=Wolbachia endosymbiont of Ctenocephalides felis wCfeJ TaxID=2732594 RepID=UPI001448648D|nr:hypothetical protein [Wolbachia endosymbiont of Ctenocephalides felis wCfeJ]WCR58514.1 MAG: hypothetical protein PG980_000986 [Wolbachia endosymbiont of Ctenocephalides felis wCfeJ]